MTDERIKKDLVDQMYWDGRVDASQVNVEVADGKVILNGTVPTYFAKQAAEADAYAILGVTYVENRLEVLHPDERYRLTDDEIAVNVRSILLWSPEVDAADIRPEAVSGLVTLEGTVDAYWKKQRAEELASTVMGVTGIVNNLAVIPTESVTDKYVGEGVMLALERDGRIATDTIDVTVKDGTVHLAGTVKDWAAYRAAEEAARNAPGVTGVRNDLLLS